MTTKQTLLDLADRVEALTAPTYNICEEVFFVCNPGPSVFGCSSYHNEAIDAHSKAIKRFKQFVDVEAWFDAALTLIPDGWLIVQLTDLGDAGGTGCRLGNPGTVQQAYSDNGAKTMALALLAAILRARAD